MIVWETVQFADESLPRSWTDYGGVHCVCEPSLKHVGKYGFFAITSKGEWIAENYKLIIVYEHWTDLSFKGCDSLEEAQSKCLKIVDQYREGKIEPTIMERGQVGNSNSTKYGKRRKRK